MTRFAGKVPPLLCAFASLWGGPLEGQVGMPADTLGPYVLERTIRDRWVFGGQHPGFVPFETVTEGIDLELRITRAPTLWRRMRLDLRGTRADLDLEPDNRVRSLVLDLPPRPVRPAASEAERAEGRRLGLRGQGNAMNLPEARFWEVPFVLPPRPLAPGLTWTDTLTFLADPGEGLLQSLREVRQVEVVGDTVVDRGTYPLVRTRAQARYRSVEPHRDHALRGELVVETDVGGSLWGWAVVDTLLGVRVLGADSMAWEGMATLHTPDGRTFSSPVRYEGTRTWVLRDSLEWGVLQDSVRAQRERQRTSVLAMPHLPLEERLAAGDSALADSLMGAWRDSHDPNERQEVWRLLGRWGSGSGVSGARLREWGTRARLELGDTAGVVEEILQSWSRPLGQEQVEILLSYLDDMDRLWHLGINPRFLYAQLAEDLLLSSPLLEPDSSRWRCTPEACRRLVAMAETAREPLLRDAALVGAFARDPLAWAGAAEVRAAEGSIPALEALRMAEGVAAIGPAEEGTPVPEPGEDWRAWLAWMGGRVQFNQRHRHALRLYAAATGRDPVPELAEGWPVQGDSARLVVGTILRDMRALPPRSSEELARELRTGPRELAQSAIQEVTRLLTPSRAREAEPDLVLELLPALLDSMMAGGTVPWPWLPGVPLREGSSGPGPWGRIRPQVGSLPVILVDEGLPPGLAELLPPALRLLGPQDVQAWPRREAAAFLRLRPLRVEGPFVSLGWSWRVLEDRTADEAPRGHVRGETLHLMATEEGWRLISRVSYIS